MGSKNTSLQRNFNLIAPFYNFLKRIFLLNGPEKATSNFICQIPIRGNVLIVGGGNDNALEEVLKQPHVNRVTQLDISSKLINQSKRRNATSQERIEYKVADFFSFQDAELYDFVIMPFFLDLFTEEEVSLLMLNGQQNLKLGGKLIIIDFQNSSRTWTLNNLKIVALYFLFWPLTKRMRFSIPKFSLLVSDRDWELLDDIRWRSYQALTLQKSQV